jgi:hypothetical protein
MKKNEVEYNLKQKQIYLRSIECVENGMSSGYNSPTKLNSKISKAGYDILFN